MPALLGSEVPLLAWETWTVTDLLISPLGRHLVPGQALCLCCSSRSLQFPEASR